MRIRTFYTQLVATCPRRVPALSGVVSCNDTEASLTHVVGRLKMRELYVPAAVPQRPERQTQTLFGYTPHKVSSLQSRHDGLLTCTVEAKTSCQMHAKRVVKSIKAKCARLSTLRLLLLGLH